MRMRPSDKTKTFSLAKIYGTTLRILTQQRSVLVPYAIFAAFEVVSLVVFYLSPRAPFKVLLGPPIRTFWGEQFLHYPFNFILLPKLVSNAKMVMVVLVGSLLTAAAVALFHDAYLRRKGVLAKALATGAKKYLGVFLVFAFITLAYYFSEKFFGFAFVKYFQAHRKFLFLGPRFWLGGPVQVAMSMGLSILIQLPFAFTVPLLVIGNQKLFKAVSGSLKLLKEHFFRSLVLVTLPVIAYLPLVVLHYNVPFLMETFVPEVVVLLILISIVVSTLVLDPIMTLSFTSLYLMQKEHTQKEQK